MTTNINIGVPGHRWLVPMDKIERIIAEGRARQKPVEKRVSVNGKICPACDRDLPVTKFHKRSSAKDGLCYRCKECKLAYDRKYREGVR